MRIHTYMYAICIYIYVYAYTCTYMYVFMFVHNLHTSHTNSHYGMDDRKPCTMFVKCWEVGKTIPFWDGDVVIQFS